MNERVAVAAVAFAALLAACTAGPPASTPTPEPAPTASPTVEPTPAPTPTPEPEGNVFVSQRYGYTLALPDDQWFVVERPGEWAAATTFHQESPGVDRVLHRMVTLYRHDVFINSQPLADDTTFEDWLVAYDQLQRTEFTNCQFSDAFETATVDGVQARVGTAVCGGDRWAEAIWFVDLMAETQRRVYVLRIGERSGSEPQIDPRQEIEVWLDRIDLGRHR